MPSLDVFAINVPSAPVGSTSVVQTMRSAVKLSSTEGMSLKEGPAYIIVAPFNKTLGTASGKPTAVSDKFLLQSLNEVRQERAQIIETFSDPTVLFFGERVRVYTMTGTLLDAIKGDADEVAYNWAVAFRLFYEDVLRGTQLAKGPSIAALVVNDQVYWGYPTNLNMNTDSRNPYLCTFNMSWIILQQDYVPPTQTTLDGTLEVIRGIKDLYRMGQNSILDTATNARVEELNNQIAALDKEISILAIQITATPPVNPTEMARLQTSIQEKQDSRALLKIEKIKLLDN